MAFKRGNGSVNVELARLQFWAEVLSPILEGDDREAGLIREWRDFQSQGHAVAKILKVGFIALGFICGVPAVLVSLSVLGIIHLR